MSIPFSIPTSFFVGISRVQKIASYSKKSREKDVFFLKVKD
jgi:hypothetical protein